MPVPGGGLPARAYASAGKKPKPLEIFRRIPLRAQQRLSARPRKVDGDGRSIRTHACGGTAVAYAKGITTSVRMRP